MVVYGVPTRPGSYVRRIQVGPLRVMDGVGQNIRQTGPGGGLIGLTMLGQRGGFLASAELDLGQAQGLIVALQKAIEQAAR